MLDFIKKIIEFLTGNLKIIAFSNNKKTENKIDGSIVKSSVQQAEIINNHYNNLPDNKDKFVVKIKEPTEEEKRAEKLAQEQKTKQIMEERRNRYL